MMARLVGIGLATPQRHPIPMLSTVFPSSKAAISVSTSIITSRWRRRRRTTALPRRLIVGLGASFLDQIARMASGLFPSSSSSFSSAYARTSSSVEQVLNNVEWPDKFPLKDEDFQRFDQSPDPLFYSEPRLVTHIDDPAIRALTNYYSQVFPASNTPGACLLDLCSSWVSHFPAGYKQDRIVGLGMNEAELKRNPVLTEYIIQDLNDNPKLPFEDNAFDVITNAVSVDYLTKPIEVFKEMQRILKPGGLAIMSFSNRCFWTKAISIWTSTGDADHVWIVGSYFHYAGGFEPPQSSPESSACWQYFGAGIDCIECYGAFHATMAPKVVAVDISPNLGRSDPMYIVQSRKVAIA